MAVIPGQTYHEVSTVQEGWGLQLIEKIPASLTKSTKVIVDAACGTGRLTVPLLQRFPHARMYAVDKSAEMLATAKEHLKASAAKIIFIKADLQSFTIPEAAQIIYCNSAYHWIENQQKLLDNFFSLLSPGGWLFLAGAEKNNLRRCRGYAVELMQSTSFATYFKNWQPDSYPNTAEGMCTLLQQAGFIGVTLEPMCYDHSFSDRQGFLKFARSTFLNSALVYLPTAQLREEFVSSYMQLYEKHQTDYELDVSRLIITAQKSS